MDLDWARRLVRFLLLSGFILLLFIVQKTVHFFSPSLYRKFHVARRPGSPMGKTDMDVDDYIGSYVHASNIFHMWLRVYYDCVQRVATRGHEAPNPTVLTQDGQKEVSLLATAKPGRPLVLNFGSCS